MTDSARDDVAPTLAGKVAIVTGGGRDIGRACALRLASAGSAVAINYHSSGAGGPSAPLTRSLPEAAGRLQNRGT